MHDFQLRLSAKMSGIRGTGQIRSNRLSSRPVATLLALFGISFMVSFARTHSDGSSRSVSAQVRAVPVFSATVLNIYPHDSQAFTQGLEFHARYLYESTGIAGQSSLRRVALESGKALKKIDLSPEYFGEGLTVFRGKIYQLTWLSKKGFVYDPQTFKMIGSFHYETEGWGLTHDNKFLIMSDGTNRLQFIEPTTFQVVKTIDVYSGKEAVANLNELEYIDGQIYANVWHSQTIARIDPASGNVRSWIDLAALAAREQHGSEDVLNGIAYDQERRRLFVTGKHWAHLIEIKIDNKPES
jgi:glutaminyl-peptide cyclotransferase